MTEDSKPRRWYLVAGFVVIAIAAWLLLDAAGVPVPSMGRLWPLFVVLGAVASILDWVRGSRAPGSLGRGVAGLGFAALFFAFTFQVLGWKDLGAWWPALPAIAGVAFLASWIASRLQATPQLVLGILCLGVGLTGLANRFDWLARITPPPAVAWAILLLLLGAFLLRKSLAKGKTPDPPV